MSEELERTDEEQGKQQEGKKEDTIAYSKYVGVKESLGRKIAKLEDENERLRGRALAAESKSEALDEEVQKLREDAKSPESAAKVKQLEEELEKLRPLKDKALDDRRKALVEKHKLNAEKVNALSEDQLAILEDTISAAESTEEVKEEKKTSGVDLTSGGGTAAKIDMSSTEMMKAGFEQRKIK